MNANDVSFIMWTRFNWLEPVCSQHIILNDKDRVHDTNTFPLWFWSMNMHANTDEIHQKLDHCNCNFFFCKFCVKSTAIRRCVRACMCGFKGRNYSPFADWIKVWPFDSFDTTIAIVHWTEPTLSPATYLINAIQNNSNNKKRLSV